MKTRLWLAPPPPTAVVARGVVVWEHAGAGPGHAAPAPVQAVLPVAA